MRLRARLHPRRHRHLRTGGRLRRLVRVPHRHPTTRDRPGDRGRVRAEVRRGDPGRPFPARQQLVQLRPERDRHRQRHGDGPTGRGPLPAGDRRLPRRDHRVHRADGRHPDPDPGPRRPGAREHRRCRGVAAPPGGVARRPVPVRDAERRRCGDPDRPGDRPIGITYDAATATCGWPTTRGASRSSRAAEQSNVRRAAAVRVSPRQVPRARPSGTAAWVRPAWSRPGPHDAATRDR